MTVREYQLSCYKRLTPGCSGVVEEGIRAALGLCEKAGAVARVVRSNSFCHKSEPEDKEGLKKAIKDMCFWLAVVCEMNGMELSDFLEVNSDGVPKGPNT